MNQLCDHFLAGAAFAQDQNVDIDIRKQFDLAMDFQHLRRSGQKEIAAAKLFKIWHRRHVIGNMCRRRGICAPRLEYLCTEEDKSRTAQLASLGRVNDSTTDSTSSRVSGMVKVRLIPSWAASLRRFCSLNFVIRQTLSLGAKLKS